MALPLIGLALKLVPFVPLLTRWLSGDNPGPIAEKVIQTAQTITGSTTPQEAVDAIINEPDKQRAFVLAMEIRSDELEKAYLVDRQDARKRDAEIQKLKGRNTRGDFLAYLAIAALIAVIMILTLGFSIPETNEKLLYITLGALIVIVKDVYGFEFGGSKGSERNQQALADLTVSMKNGNGGKH